MAMKNILFIISLFLTISVSAQKDKTVIFFKDGTSLEGLGKLLPNEKIKFRLDKKTKPVKYHFKDIERVDIYYPEGAAIYVYVEVRSKRARVLEEIVYGEKATLYKMDPKGFSPAIGFGFGTGGPGGGVAVGGTVGGSHSYGLDGYYIKKAEDKEAIDMGNNLLFSSHFKKAIKGYFGDCAALVKKVENGEWTFEHIIEIVEYYNKQCE